MQRKLAQQDILCHVVGISKPFSILVVLLTLVDASSAAASQSIRFDGDGSDLQQMFDRADAGSTIVCNPKRRIEISTPITIRKAITLQGLNVALPRGLSKTSLLVVEAEGVTIQTSEFHGNFDSVPQSERAPLVWLQGSKFSVQRVHSTTAPKMAS